MALPILRLKPGRERSLDGRHPWVFSGAISDCQIPAGSCARLLSASGEFKALVYVSPHNSLRARVLSFLDRPVTDVVHEHVARAVRFRERLFRSTDVQAYRLLNAEADQLPGLVVDCYAGHLVMQVSTYGMRELREHVLEALSRYARPLSIYERSDSASRAEENLQDEIIQWRGETPEAIDVLEYGLKMRAFPKSGQKTGMFLDQREMRRSVGEWVSRYRVRRLLNCFAYHGGFSLSACRAGCSQVTSVETSGEALQELSRLITQNGQDPNAHQLLQQDVFEFLREDSSEFDAIILDPPAFVKRRNQLMQGCRGYKEINRQAIKRLPPDGLLWTFSCSHFVDQKLFRQVLFQAAADSGRSVQLIQDMTHSPDHPTSIFHPEGTYLKGCLLRISD